MATLLESTPDDLRYCGEQAVFYYGTTSLGVANLPIGARYTCVYSPAGEQGWKSVQFQLVEENNARLGGMERWHRVKAKRFLEPHEIDHFIKKLAKEEQL